MPGRKWPSPKSAERLLSWLVKAELLEEILGDLSEYHEELADFPAWKRWVFHWFHVLNFLRPWALKRLIRTNSNYTAMYRNYFKIGYRNLLKNKVYSLINVGGLAVGITVSLLIGLWIHDELSYNKYHDSYDRIAQVMQHQSYNGNVGTQNSVPYPMGDELRARYGDDFKYVVMASWLGDHILSTGDQTLFIQGNYMDVEAPHLLSLKMLKGSRDGLKEPGSVLLSESASQALFGIEDPIGKPLKIDKDVSVVVTGVYRDLPFNTEMRDLKFIAPWRTYVSSYDWVQRQANKPQWDNNSFQLFVQMADHAETEQVSEKIKKLKYDQLPEEKRVTNPEVFLHPMADWHLHSNWENGVKTGGFIEYVWLFGVIGAFVLVLACVNFMNLTTARSESRSREVGIRKSVGSTRSQLIAQFLSESLLVVVMAFAVSVVLVLLALPSFNQLVDKQITFPAENPIFWLASLGFVLATCLIAGGYPAFYLSSVGTVRALKGTFRAGASAGRLREALVVMQFTVSVTLIIATLMVARQIDYSRNRSIGFDNERIIMIEVLTTDFEGKYNLIRNELKNLNAIDEMAYSSSPLTDVWNGNGGFQWEGKDPGFNDNFATFWVSHDFGKMIGWEIVDGRDFSRDLASDSTAYIINETAVRYMGIEDPVGKTINNGVADHKIIGVAKDMLVESPFRSVQPAIYILNYDNMTNFILLKLSGEKGTGESLAQVEQFFKSLAPNVPFDFKFADQEYARKFAAEERIGQLSAISSALAIFISCLGLYGLASFMASQRTKEIGIRKVLGASVASLWKLLTAEFFVLVLVSILAAVPIAYYGLHAWLENYEYRTPMSWWIFAWAGMSAFVVALATVSYQVFKAATANPVQSLRAE